MIRPKLLPKTTNKARIRSSMLNENNKDLQNLIIKAETKEVMDDHVGDEFTNFKIVEQDIHHQELSFKIRLLKRQNKYDKRTQGDFSICDISTIS